MSARIHLLLALALAAHPVVAQSVTCLPRDADDAPVRVDLAWEDAWRDERNHDAVWLVVRDLGDPERGLVRLAGARSASGAVRVELADGVGVFVSRAAAGSGDVAARIVLAPESPLARDAELAVTAIEMVYVPAGAFELGDTHADAVAHGALHTTGAASSAGEPEVLELFRVEHESPIEVGAGPGRLRYQSGDVPQYRGDGEGPIPAAFPKGTRAFYVMKHELRQGAYAAFLNELPEAWRAARSNADVEADGAESCTIRRAESGFQADAPERPCNFVDWDDTSAYLDWVGLRPLTELEFEKAARGPTRPAPLDYPWGDARRETTERVTLPSRDLAAVDVDDPNTPAARARLGRSYYGVYDLAGSLWERVVTIGNPRGRAFTGSHGDGRLSDGRADQHDWPAGADDGRAADGIGYRGGAQYFTEPGITNPFSPVGVRTYAAWNGAFRAPTYSARGARTAPEPVDSGQPGDSGDSVEPDDSVDPDDPGAPPDPKAPPGR